MASESLASDGMSVAENECGPLGGDVGERAALGRSGNGCIPAPSISCESLGMSLGPLFFGLKTGLDSPMEPGRAESGIRRP
jgi:hypothetical protein